MVLNFACQLKFYSFSPLRQIFIVSAHSFSDFSAQISVTTFSEKFSSSQLTVFKTSNATISLFRQTFNDQGYTAEVFFSKIVVI